MFDDLTAKADQRLQEALTASGARDPRTFYRERLRELKAANPTGYEQAVTYYQNELIPAVANGPLDPLVAWMEYGRELAESLAPGRTVSIDATGISSPYVCPAPPDHLVLHLPDDNGVRALLVGLPADLSPAQRATYDVLVAGKHKAPAT